MPSIKKCPRHSDSGIIEVWLIYWLMDWKTAAMLSIKTCWNKLHKVICKAKFSEGQKWKFSHQNSASRRPHYPDSVEENRKTVLVWQMFPTAKGVNEMLLCRDYQLVIVEKLGRKVQQSWMRTVVFNQFGHLFERKTQMKNETFWHREHIKDVKLCSKTFI